MWRRGWSVGLVLIWAGVAWAGEAVLQNAATLNGDGANISVADRGSVGLRVTITGSATVTFQGSTDGGVTWTAILCRAMGTTAEATSTTASGQYQCEVGGLTHVRAPISGCASCTVTVTAFASVASLKGRGGGFAHGTLDSSVEPWTVTYHTTPANPLIERWPEPGVIMRQAGHDAIYRDHPYMASWGGATSWYLNPNAHIYVQPIRGGTGSPFPADFFTVAPTGTPVTGDTFLHIASPTFTGNLTALSIDGAVNGAYTMLLSNTGTSTTADAGIELRTNNSTGGDTWIRFNVVGGRIYTMGVDNSAPGNPLVISDSGTLGMNNLVTYNASGIVGMQTWMAVTFANLGTPANGSIVYCSDCVIGVTCAGGGTGAFAKRLAGAWNCS